MAPIDVVSDYEEVTGSKPPQEPEAKKQSKVVTPTTPDVKTKG
ncbi:hypothetical protein ACIPY5_12115 [Microbacterium sp. NPDC089698]